MNFVDNDFCSPDDRTLKIWDTKDWSLVKDVTEPFEDAPNDSSIWFYRPA